MVLQIIDCVMVMICVHHIKICNVDLTFKSVLSLHISVHMFDLGKLWREKNATYKLIWIPVQSESNYCTYLQSDSLTKAIYDTPWIDASMYFRKNMRIMISRSMKPSYLTGGKLYIMSLETYRAVRSF